MVTSSSTLHNAVMEMSSRAKSFPPSAVLRLRIQISAVLFPPEFQIALNGVHSHGVDTALTIGPMGVPLIENCSSAGDDGLTDATQAETLYN